MKIKTFQVKQYRGCPIYYRNFGSHFEYLTVVNNQIYTAHISVRPTTINLILYWLKIAPEKYCDKQYKNILEILRRIAVTVIEKTFKDEKEARDKAKKNIIK